VILPDTSAWVEFLRATGSPIHHYLRDLISTDTPLATTETVVMEVLAGARDQQHLQRLRRLLLRCELIPARTLADYEAAAVLYRTCRRQGETIRSLSDCLIAVVALRAGASVLHADRDFEALARYSALSIAEPPNS
jgi:predicted nucleic acid-binding protein